ncbi:hypothetical protein U9M48_003369 [Paspalum notatum var. saurae]|uniref:Uncharacterized protein n=1 Tax=Paspalum notatum var. saurae TaxID=547442 RepID=A0AAQ3SKJ7_PASNO
MAALRPRTAVASASLRPAFRRGACRASGAVFGHYPSWQLQRGLLFSTRAFRINKEEGFIGSQNQNDQEGILQKQGSRAAARASKPSSTVHPKIAARATSKSQASDDPPLSGNISDWRSKSSTKRFRGIVACAKSYDSEFESVDAPLEPQTWEGSFLCGLLKNLPHIFLAAAAKQLQELSNQREDTLSRWEHSIGSKEDFLHSNQVMELLKKPTKPTTLGNNSVLSLTTGAGDRGLALGGPRDQVIAEEDIVAESRVLGVGTPCPVCVRVRSKGLGQRGAEVKACRERTLHIAQDVLDQGKVRLAQVRHEETKIRTSQSLVLESASKTPILRGVGEGRAISGI